ncbi:hypothetical protein OOK27_47780 [Streptomyces canus]|uniref:hypothetical protein n=1 Tax=Streptomyces canus TaxID=58343 RepID=UPI00224FC5ED|nr:hypothetical protein [Streptomyces canus]MCX5261746.1 hypothetical protein [Streptomyces canus]
MSDGDAVAGGTARSTWSVPDPARPITRSRLASARSVAAARNAARNGTPARDFTA